MERLKRAWRMIKPQEVPSNSADSDLEGQEQPEKGGNQTPPKSRQDSIREGWASFVTILGFIAAVVTIIVATLQWHALESNYLRYTIIACSIFFAATLARLNLRFRAKKLSRELVMDITLAGVFCICATLAIAAGPPFRAVSSKASIIKVQDPRATSDNPVPQVGCTPTISGTVVKKPNNHVVVVGYTILGRSWYFQPHIQWQGHTWKVTLHVGGTDAGKFLRLAVFTMPKDSERNLDSLYGASNPASGGGWVYIGLPSSHTGLFEESLQRTGINC